MLLKNNRWQPFLFKITIKHEILLSEIMVIPGIYTQKLLREYSLSNETNRKKIHRVVFEITRNKILGAPAL